MKKGYGRNELLIPTITAPQAKDYSSLDDFKAALETYRKAVEHACLKAYRDGAFFARYSDTDLKITSVSYDENNGTFEITAVHCDKIDITVDGVTTTHQNRDPSQPQTVSVSNLKNATYIRAAAMVSNPKYQTGQPIRDEVNDLYLDIVFTQPIMINPLQNRSYDPMYDKEDEEPPTPPSGDNDGGEGQSDEPTRAWARRGWLWG